MKLLDIDYNWVDVGELVLSALSLFVAGLAAYFLIRGNKDIQSQVTSLASMASSIQSYHSMMLDGYRKVNMPDFKLEYCELRYSNMVQLRCTNYGGEAVIMRIEEAELDYQVDGTRSYSVVVNRGESYHAYMYVVSVSPDFRMKRVAMYIYSTANDGNQYRQLIERDRGIQDTGKFIRHKPELLNPNS